MIVGLGTDIIEIQRIKKALNSEKFKELVYSVKERRYCESRGEQAAASFAARFAGKEAFFKALGTGIICALSLVEILNDAKGKPILKLSGEALKLVEDRNIKNLHMTLSHSREYATATCIFEN